MACDMLLVEPSSDAQGVRVACGPPSPGRSARGCVHRGSRRRVVAAEQEAGAPAGCVLASLGQMTLRADAVGLVAVSLVNFTFDDAGIAARGC